MSDIITLSTSGEFYHKEDNLSKIDFFPQAIVDNRKTVFTA